MTRMHSYVFLSIVNSFWYVVMDRYMANSIVYSLTYFVQKYTSATIRTWWEDFARRLSEGIGTFRRLPTMTSRLISDEKTQCRSQMFVLLAKPLETAKTIHKILVDELIIICKFAILLDWKIQIHLSKAIWALKWQISAVQYRYLIRNCWNYLKFCGAIQLLLCTGKDIHAQCTKARVCTREK
jgi:hypothetical protein